MSSPSLRELLSEWLRELFYVLLLESQEAMEPREIREELSLMFFKEILRRSAGFWFPGSTLLSMSVF